MTAGSPYLGPTQFELDVADLFCGLGGSSTGLLRAASDFGVHLWLTAVNHWKRAINSHGANHPFAKHLNMDVDALRKGDLLHHNRTGRKLRILWLSPSCTEHSYAKGGHSIDDQNRASAWAGVKEADRYRPDIVIVENVRPFMNWGPVEPVFYRNGKPKLDKKGNQVYRPIKPRKGETYRNWFASMCSAGPGYTGDWKLLNAADYGEAQTRVRWFGVFTAPGIHWEWPEPTHDKLGRNGLPKWVGAREIIDLTLESQSIFDRKDKPLSDNTLERIEAGIPRFVPNPENQEVLVLTLRKHANAKGLDDPLPTVCSGAKGSGQHAVVQFSATPYTFANRTNNQPRDIDEPSATVTTAPGSGGLYLAEAGAAAFTLGQHGGGIAHGIDEPVSTIATDGYVRVVDPYLVKVHGSLTKGETPASRVRSLDDPSLTITTNRHGTYLAEPFIVPQMNSSGPQSIDNPLGTITTTSRGIRLVESFLVAHFGEREGQAPRVRGSDMPAWTVTHRGCGDLAEADVTQLGDGLTDEFQLLAKVVDSDNKMVGLLVCYKRVIYLVDIRFRMIDRSELKQFQGLPIDYVIDGNKSEQTAQIGNAVPEKVAYALGCSAYRALGYRRAYQEDEAA